MPSCFMCETPLSGGIDTFGDHDAPLCSDCWLGFAEDRVAQAHHARECGLGFRVAYEAKDWDQCEKWRFKQMEGLTDSPIGLVSFRFSDAAHERRREANHA